MHNFTATHHRAVRFWWGITAVVCGAEVLSFKWTPRDAWVGVPVLMLTAPFFLFSALHMLLMYRSWFAGPKRAAPLLRYVKFAMFYVACAAFLAVMAGFI